MKMKFLFILFIVSVTSASAQTSLPTIEPLLKDGEFQKAENLLQETTRENPNNAEAFSYLGDIYSFKRDWEKAIEAYGKAVKIEPKNSDFHFKLGGAYGMKALSVPRIEALLYISDIKKNLERAAELNSHQIGSRRALVELYIQLPGILGGSTNKAKMYARELDNISKVNALLAKGFIAKNEDEKEDAAVYYKKAFEIYPSSKEKKNQNNLNYELGKVAAEQKINLQQGLNLLDEYIKNYNYKDIYFPEWAYYQKARIYVSLQQKESATKSIDKALALKKDFKEAQQEKERIENL